MKRRQRRWGVLAGVVMVAVLSSMVCWTQTANSASLQPAQTEVGDRRIVLEPSALTWDGDQTLYLVSDNGKVCGKRLDAALWDCMYEWPGGYSEKPDKVEKAEHDFEGIAYVPSRPAFLYIGVEGTLNLPPTIKEFSLTERKFTGNFWRLGDIGYAEGSGMESLTFVPDETAEARPPFASASSQGFGGHFLAASQARAADTKGEGWIYAYDLPLKNAQEEAAKTDEARKSPFSSSEKFYLRDRGTSELYFSPSTSVLYAGYDAEGCDSGEQSVWEFKAGSKGYYAIAHSDLPTCGSEAVTVVDVRPADQRSGSPDTVDLYVGLDMSPKQKRAVYKSETKKDLDKGKEDGFPNRIERFAAYPGRNKVSVVAAIRTGYADQQAPSEDHETDPALIIDGKDGDIKDSKRQAYVLFDLSAVNPATAADITMRAYVSKGDKVKIPALWLTDADADAKLDWTNQPAKSGSSLTLGGEISIGEWLEYNGIQSLLTGTGTVRGFLLEPRNNSGLEVNSKNADRFLPYLIVTRP